MKARKIEAALAAAACKRRRSSGEPRSPTGKEETDNHDFRAVLDRELARMK